MISQVRDCTCVCIETSEKRNILQSMQIFTSVTCTTMAHQNAVLCKAHLTHVAHA